MLRKVVFALVLLFGIYLLWSVIGKTPPVAPPANISYVRSFGKDTDKGNLLGIQPYVLPACYASEANFEQFLDAYFERAKTENWLIPQKTIVVLPEYLGTWLVVANEKSSVYEAKTIDEGLTSMVMSNVFSFVTQLASVPDSTKDSVKHAVFALKAPQMAEIYQRVFAKLAKKYQVTIVAGSILLPDPHVVGGELKTHKGRLYNVTAVFRPDGSLYDKLVKKAFPTGDELSFVCPVDPRENPVFDTPIGRLGVMVCADSWFSSAYQNLKTKKADFVVIPSYSLTDGAWDKPWGGYSGAPTPGDAKADIGKITEGQAWLKHAMGGRAKAEGGLTKGVNVFLRGQLWDLGADGTTVVLDDSATVTKKVKGGTLVNLWL
ncbi:carbon-nitrogen hydrolase family protein [Runella sp.]|uniref:carbon-nitrogen hydrolase family protein n=1 Tax=Runella sp. TaxID=1960881 RepID=UPI003D1401F8